MPLDPLAPSRAAWLEGVAGSRLLLAFDYDGVLAPLVTDPEGVSMPPRTRRLVVRLVERYPVAIVSGRSWRHLRRLAAVPGPVLVGNHGFELGRAVPVPAGVERRMERWTAELEGRLDGVPGWFVEHKGSTLSLHYGRARARRAVERAVHAAASQLRGVRLVRGKNVLNVVPAGFPTKGDAVVALLRRLGLDTALFLGDDVTDEDAFEVGPPAVLGVKVGPGRTAARYRLRRQGQVDALLARLVELRPPARAGRGSR